MIAPQPNNNSAATNEIRFTNRDILDLLDGIRTFEGAREADYWRVKAGVKRSTAYTLSTVLASWGPPEYNLKEKPSFVLTENGKIPLHTDIETEAKKYKAILDAVLPVQKPDTQV